MQYADNVVNKFLKYLKTSLQFANALAIEIIVIT